ncbi:hypothetical protein [Chryseobacterium sp. MEBOG07]|uniref:hypothetical protein n=1 Tax=Chryseobacterium sp. MEBOG07 TaxID=2879939 RepID=UPI001F3DCB4D|nr:hypothetical protein [Chryseobacterium sp. MEBOG07]UKB77954.1 hypothetical protein LF886_15855 [Chryseobacterium sp. MEBOG07]
MIILKRMYWKITILGKTTIEYGGKNSLPLEGWRKFKEFLTGGFTWYTLPHCCSDERRIS